MAPEDQSVLRAFGLPDASIAAAPNASGEDLRTAIRHALAAGVSGRDVDILAAWLSAFAHHWPTAFRSLLGPDGEALRKKCVPADANRYLKLRRIATENLQARLNAMK